MAAPATNTGWPTRSGPVAHLPLKSEAPTSGYPEVLVWLAEAKRLFAEAEERFQTGRFLPALSSLAAVPPLHRMLVDRCSELLDAGDRDDGGEAPLPSGMYL